jgi:hypothetical protein
MTDREMRSRVLFSIDSKLRKFKMLPDGKENILYLFVENGLEINGEKQYKIATILDIKNLFLKD